MADKGNGKATNRFGEDTDCSPSGIVARGVLVGSLISVITIAAFCAVSAARGQWNQGMAWCVSTIVAGIAGGLLQQLWFSYSVPVRLSYPARIGGFGLTYFVVLAACAAAGSWIPRGEPWAWLSFALTYLVVLAVTAAAYAIAFRRQGASYTERLEAYRRQRSK